MTLSFEVFDLNFPVGSLNKSAVLVTGPTEAVLVDAGFTRADGHRLVAAILDSGKTLTTVFVSHADPDFYFGLEIIAEAFPEAIVTATPIVIEHISASFEGKLKAWATLGTNLPTRFPEISPLTSDTITVDGEELELRGGSELLPDRHYLWYPAQRVILGGVLVFQQEHVWTADTATPELRSAWVDQLDAMSALDPITVIPGHRLPDTANDASALRYTRTYLDTFEKVLAETTDGAAATALLNQKYPDSGMGIAAQIGTKVAKGEMTWG
ncbi:MBL fold metallo-hydrolase [Pseudoclavibacter sp. RFBI5]|uniref:MBL fold metallo-hydrolase n=1 Tax=Pseudoclavibacter sp. RFBI5 TaxID=2080578 RepID=UPI000CE75AD1|nr:MBL fold metallo-hydrolase [Pseudoclavibacter sp. RFBI5]PPG01914.1 MBL fold metallo-hydrolase [Pseudoclavibacter sp. RFBI5]